MPADKPPLTVADITGYQPDANLRTWKLTQDVAGGYSYRARIDGVLYIAIPEAWEGRTMAQTAAPAGANFGLDLKELPRQLGEEIRTNAGTYRPAGAENAVLNGVAAVPAPAASCDADPYQQYYGPGALLAGLLVIAFMLKKGAR